MSSVATERVLVVPTERFRELGYFQGFHDNSDHYVEGLLKPEFVSFRPRSEMETDPSFKQLIPYVIFRHTNEDGTVRIFQYTRGKGVGEQRLKSKKSVGVGGHISADDTDGADDPYLEGMRRELEEEVKIEAEYTQQCVGMINDDENEVGRVHLGVVHIFDVKEPKVCSNESELIESGFFPVSEMLADLSGFETWSSICLEALFGNK